MENEQLKFIKSRRKDPFFRELQTFLIENEPKEKGDYYKFGYETFGIVLYGFCKWLIEDLRKRGIKRVLFLARDGYIMKKAFELFEESNAFRTDYIYVSRRSLRVPQLWMENNNKLRAIIPTRFITVEELLSSVGLNYENYKNIITQYGLTSDEVLKADQISIDKRVESLLECIWPDVVKNSKDEYKAFEEYVRSFELTGDVAIVDIGWRGSMQHFLQRLSDKIGLDVTYHGYYITLSSDMVKGQDMHGYLGNVDNNSNGCNALRGFIGLIEMMFLMTEGSTEKYILIDNKPEVKLYEYEYSHNGEMFEEVDKIQELQKGALDFIKGFIQEDWEEKFSSYEAFSYICDFANKPTLNELKMFADFRFLNNGTVSHLVESKGMAYYLRHPKRLKKDLYLSRWRIGFMKHIFRLPMPYYEMFQIMLKVT